MLKKLFIIAITVSLLAGSAFAETSKTNVSVVYVQNAKSSKLTIDAKQPTAIKFVLHKPELYASYFSDRPQRLTGMVELKKLLTLWNAQNKSKFYVNPPNAAIETKQSNLIGMLSNPVYDNKTGDLTFNFKPIKPLPADFKFGKSLGYTIIFIDDVGWDPGGFGTGG